MPEKSNEELFAELDKRADTIASLIDEKNNFISALAHRVNKIETLEKDLEFYKKNNADLAKDAAEELRHSRRLGEVLEKANREVNKLSKEKTILENKLVNQKFAYDGVIAVGEKSENKIKDLEKELNELKKNKRELLEDIDVIEHEKAGMAEEIVELEDVVERLEETLVEKDYKLQERTDKNDIIDHLYKIQGNLANKLNAERTRYREAMMFLNRKNLLVEFEAE